MNKKGEELPAGSDTSGRRGGNIVPVPFSSTTCDGLPGGLRARPPPITPSAYSLDADEAARFEVDRRWRSVDSSHRSRYLGGCMPEGWMPEYLPRYSQIGMISEEVYTETAWAVEDKVLEAHYAMEVLQDWIGREKVWRQFADCVKEEFGSYERMGEKCKELEGKCKGFVKKDKDLEGKYKDLEGKYKELEGKYKELEKKKDKKSKKGKEKWSQTEEKNRNEKEKGTQTDGTWEGDNNRLEVSEVPSVEGMDVDAPPTRDRMDTIEANLEEIAQAVSSLGKSFDSLGGRFAKELGEVRELVRNVRPVNIPPPLSEVEDAPPLSYAHACGGTHKGVRSAGGGVGVRKRKRKLGSGVVANAPPTRGGRDAGPAPPAPVAVHPPVSRGHPAAGMGVAGVNAPSPPQTAAVLVRAKEGEEGFDYVDALRRVKAQVPLPEGAAGTSVRRSANGGLLVEVCGPRSGEAADGLVERLSSLLPEASVRRAERSGEVRLVGFDEAVLPAELARALAGCANCEASKVRMGVPRWGPRGIGVAWARLPLAAALSAARVGQFAMGWSTVRVEYLESRPLQCHRCWGYGHMRAQCPSTNTDRSRTCYRCGQGGHIARDCGQVPSCALCSCAGLPARHRMGGEACGVARRAREGRSGRSGRRRGRPPARASPGGGT